MKDLPNSWETGVIAIRGAAIPQAASVAVCLARPIVRSGGTMGDSHEMVEPRRNGKPPTINDVARLAGVSKKTVSRVINNSPLLNDETRGRVEKVIKQLGYVPNPQARALALRRNSLIGLIHDNPNAQTVINVQQGILLAIHDPTYGLGVRRVDRTSPRLLLDLQNFLERQRLFGVVIMPPLSENDALARLCD